MPEKDFIGVEVHTPGVGSLLKQIGEQELTTLRLIQHDALEVLKLRALAKGYQSKAILNFAKRYYLDETETTLDHDTSTLDRK